MDRPYSRPECLPQVGCPREVPCCLESRPIRPELRQVQIHKIRGAQRGAQRVPNVNLVGKIIFEALQRVLKTVIPYLLRCERGLE